MEDSFRVRVDKVFGSLLPSSSSSSSSSSSQPPAVSSSLWCLTDEEIQKNHWNRETDAAVDGEDENSDDEGPFPINMDRQFLSEKVKLMADDENQNPNSNPNPNPNPNDYRKELEDDLRELDDGSGEGTSSGGNREGSSMSSRSGEEEELDVRNSIGMDCTLDYEEEEDAYDKVAVGKPEIGDRLYMREVSDYISDINSYNELPTTFEEAPRDPRANHLAAKLRLKEDAEAARSFSSLHVSDQTVAIASDAQTNTSDEGNNIKSILKRKEDQMDLKSEKRVRFESSCKTDDGNINATSEESPQQQDSSSVPDYIRNPKKYTHYTFDSSTDMNEEANRQAYADFLSILRRSKQSEPDDEVPADLSKPVIFNPKKKTSGDDLMETTDNKEAIMEEPAQRKSLPIIVAAVDGQEDEEAHEMEVEEQPTNVANMKVGNGRRTVRKYRAKQCLETKESES